MSKEMDDSREASAVRGSSDGHLEANNSLDDVRDKMRSRLEEACQKGKLVEILAKLQEEISEEQELAAVKTRVTKMLEDTCKSGEFEAVIQQILPNQADDGLDEVRDKMRSQLEAACQKGTLSEVLEKLQEESSTEQADVAALSRLARLDDMREAQQRLCSDAAQLGELQRAQEGRLVATEGRLASIEENYASVTKQLEELSRATICNIGDHELLEAQTKDRFDTAELGARRLSQKLRSAELGGEEMAALQARLAELEKAHAKLLESADKAVTSAEGATEGSVLEGPTVERFAEQEAKLANALARLASLEESQKAPPEGREDEEAVPPRKLAALESGLQSHEERFGELLSKMSETKNALKKLNRLESDCAAAREQVATVNDLKDQFAKLQIACETILPPGAIDRDSVVDGSSQASVRAGLNELESKVAGVIENHDAAKSAAEAQLATLSAAQRKLEQDLHTQAEQLRHEFTKVESSKGTREVSSTSPPHAEPRNLDTAPADVLVQMAALQDEQKRMAGAAQLQLLQVASLESGLKSVTQGLQTQEKRLGEVLAQVSACASVSRLQDDIADCKAQADTVNGLREAVASLQASCEALRVERVSSNFSASEGESAKESAQVQLAALDVVQQKLAQDLQMQSSKLAEMLTQTASTQSQVDELSSAHTKLADGLSRAETDQKALKEGWQAQEAQLVALERSFEASMQESSSLKNQLREILDQITARGSPRLADSDATTLDSLRAQFANLQAACEAYRMQNVDCQAALLQTLSQKFADVSSSGAEKLGQRLGDLEHAHNSLRKEMESSEKLRAVKMKAQGEMVKLIADQVTNLEDGLQSLTTNVIRCADQVTSLEDSVSASNRQELRSKETKDSVASGELTALRVELEQRIEDLESSLASSVDANSGQAVKVANLHDRIAKVAEELTQTRADVLQQVRQELRSDSKFQDLISALRTETMNAVRLEFDLRSSAAKPTSPASRDSMPLLDGTELLDRVEKIVEDVTRTREDMMQEVRAELQNDINASVTEASAKAGQMMLQLRDELRVELLPTVCLSRQAGAFESMLQRLSESSEYVQGSPSVRSSGVSAEDLSRLLLTLRQELLEGLRNRFAEAQMRFSEQLRTELMREMEKGMTVLAAQCDGVKKENTQLNASLNVIRKEQLSAAVQAREQQSAIDHRVSDAAAQVSTFQGVLRDCLDRCSATTDHKIRDLKEEFLRARPDISSVQSDIAGLTRRLDMQTSLTSDLSQSLQSLPTDVRCRMQELQRDISAGLGDMRAEMEQTLGQMREQIGDLRVTQERQRTHGASQLERLEAANAAVAKQSAQLENWRVEDARSAGAAAVGLGRASAAEGSREGLAALREELLARLQREEAARGSALADFAADLRQGEARHASALAEAHRVLDESTVAIARLGEELRRDVEIRCAQAAAEHGEQLREALGELRTSELCTDIIQENYVDSREATMQRGVSDAHRLAVESSKATTRLQNFGATASTAVSEAAACSVEATLETVLTRLAAVEAMLRRDPDPRHVGISEVGAATPRSERHHSGTRRAGQTEEWLHVLVEKSGEADRRLQTLEKRLPKSMRDFEEPFEEAVSHLTTGVLKMAQLIGVASDDVAEKLNWREVCMDLPRMMDHAWLRSRLPKRASLLKILRQKADAEQLRQLHEQLERLIGLPASPPVVHVQEPEPQAMCDGVGGEERRAAPSSAAQRMAQGVGGEENRAAPNSAAQRMAQAGWQKRINSPRESPQTQNRPLSARSAREAPPQDVWANTGKIVYGRTPVAPRSERSGEPPGVRLAQALGPPPGAQRDAWNTSSQHSDRDRA